MRESECETAGGCMAWMEGGAVEWGRIGHIELKAGMCVMRTECVLGNGIVGWS